MRVWEWESERPKLAENVHNPECRFCPNRFNNRVREIYFEKFLTPLTHLMFDICSPFLTVLLYICFRWSIFTCSKALSFFCIREFWFLYAEIAKYVYIPFLRCLSIRWWRVTFIFRKRCSLWPLLNIIFDYHLWSKIFVSEVSYLHYKVISSVLGPYDFYVEDNQQLFCQPRHQKYLIYSYH